MARIIDLTLTVRQGMRGVEFEKLHTVRVCPGRGAGKEVHAFGRVAELEVFCRNSSCAKDFLDGQPARPRGRLLCLPKK